MTTKSKSTHKGGASNQAAAASHATDTGAAEWAQQVVEHLVDAQKKWIDLTAQQNALVLKAVEEGMPVSIEALRRRRWATGLARASKASWKRRGAGPRLLLSRAASSTRDQGWNERYSFRRFARFSDYASQGLEAFVSAYAVARLRRAAERAGDQSSQGRPQSPGQYSGGRACGLRAAGE